MCDVTVIEEFWTIPNKRKNILYRICKGISYLHENDLIHGDIKTGNILYYSEDDIRISDFNLTIMKKWKSDIKLCTAIYRPLEVWRSKNFDWNAKIDIWCLGCLMHELLYDNEIIFPFQGKAETKDEKMNIKHKYINAIADWDNSMYDGKAQVSKYNVYYKGINVIQELLDRKSIHMIYDDDKNSYINLMLRCLNVLEERRPTIDTILLDKLFLATKSKPEIKALFSVAKEFNRVDLNFYNLMESSMMDYVDRKNRELLRAATIILYNYVKIKKVEDYRIKKVCAWIARKLLRLDSSSQKIPTDFGIPEDQILQLELDICNALNFQLHTLVG